MLALVSFMPVTEEVLAVGAIRATPKERKALAQKSKEWYSKDLKMTNAQIAEQFMLPENDATAEEELSKAGAGMPQLNLKRESEIKKELAKEQDKGPQIS